MTMNCFWTIYLFLWYFYLWYW